MNAFSKIEACQNGRIAEAMDAEGVRLIERLKVGFRVVMQDGSEGLGLSIREAITRASKVAA